MEKKERDNKGNSLKNERPRITCSNNQQQL